MKPINIILEKCPDVELEYRNFMVQLENKIKTAKDEHHHPRMSNLVTIQRFFRNFVDGDTKNDSL